MWLNEENLILKLLARSAKTMVVSMLSERVVLKVLVMLAEWASAKSSTSIDDKIVSEIRSKLEADGKLWCCWPIRRRTFILTLGVIVVDYLTPNSSKSEMSCRCGCGVYEMDDEFMRMLQELRNQINGPLRVTSARRYDAHNDDVSTAKNKKNGVHTLG